MDHPLRQRLILSEICTASKQIWVQIKTHEKLFKKLFPNVCAAIKTAKHLFRPILFPDGIISLQFYILIDLLNMLKEERNSTWRGMHGPGS